MFSNMITELITEIAEEVLREERGMPEDLKNDILNRNDPIKATRVYKQREIFNKRLKKHNEIGVNRYNDKFTVFGVPKIAIEDYFKYSTYNKFPDYIPPTYNKDTRIEYQRGCFTGFHDGFTYGFRAKNGIEILNLKPSKRNSRGGYDYQNVSVKTLKKACKDNGLKQTGDKLELVKRLMSI